VGDELVAGPALLVRVALAGEDERALDRLAVEGARAGSVAPRVELLDQREEVAQERPLLFGERRGDVVERRRLALGGGSSDLGVAVAVGRDLWLGLAGT
jgi:hypothetical protein